MKKNNKIRIAQDIDGVLANFYLAMCKKFKKPYVSLDKWDVKWIDEVFEIIEHDGDFSMDVPILSPPEAINYEIACYITARPPSVENATKVWLQYHGYPNAPLHVIGSTPKGVIIKEEKIDCLIDDKIDNLYSALDTNPELIPILFIPPYFETKKKYSNGIIPIRHLSKVKNLIYEYSA